MSLEQQLWPDAPERPVLAGGEVHVWRAELNQPEATLRALARLLSEDESERAGKFYFPRDRDHYIVARGALRKILGLYTSVAPELLRFTYNEFGKPSLLDVEHGDALRFNVSHSHGLALYAVAREREVGVDIEFVREDFAGIEIGEHFFSRREVSALRALPGAAFTKAFFDCWTRKEAYIKARGEGLSHPLERFAVSLAPGEPAALLCTDDDPLEAARWSLVELFPGEGYCAALAVEGERPTLRCWSWTASPRLSL
ncbi:MAG TPA: 4'-phosphopantetheinyl transferase superfamily protein [Pyrinomonadaceae bacterium]|nr:4'-phosphopantetheinyl transferase superfamily protein [Pyrinomonadaceae bacterium]